MNRQDKSSPRLKCKIKTNPSSSNTHDPPNQPIIIANLFHTWILLGLTRNTRMKSAQHKEDMIWELSEKQQQGLEIRIHL